MDQYGISDRRRLRRKLTFWRIAAFAVVTVALGIYVYATRPADLRSENHVARIAVTGLIRDDSDLVDRLDAIAESDAAKALIVMVDSPGGTTFGGEETYRAIRRVAVNKPVATEIRTLGASAGYMIAAAGDHIVAHETSVVGSIGVIFQYPQVSGLLDKLGVTVGEIKSAPLKAEPSPFHPASDEARAMIRSMLLDTYDWFVDLVAERRGLSHEKALALADGSVFTGRQALANGLVDAIGSENDIRAWLASRDVDRAVPVVDWKRRENGGFFWFSKAMAVIFGNAGAPGNAAAALFNGLGERKVFLDGLVSLWQFDAWPANVE